jgi:hypothetical protein
VVPTLILCHSVTEERLKQEGAAGGAVEAPALFQPLFPCPGKNRVVSARACLPSCTGAAAKGDAEARAALRECVDVLRANAQRVVLEPGELVFLDNYQVVHGRDQFAPRYDGTDRWLKRCNILRDLRKAHAHLGVRSRVVG